MVGSARTGSRHDIVTVVVCSMLASVLASEIFLVAVGGLQLRNSIAYYANWARNYTWMVFCALCLLALGRTVAASLSFRRFAIACGGSIVASTVAIVLILQIAKWRGAETSAADALASSTAVALMSCGLWGVVVLCLRRLHK